MRKSFASDRRASTRGCRRLSSNDASWVRSGATSPRAVRGGTNIAGASAGMAGVLYALSYNSITPFVGDANTQTPEYKSFIVNIEKA